MKLIARICHSLDEELLHNYFEAMLLLPSENVAKKGTDDVHLTGGNFTAEIRQGRAAA